MKYRRLGPFSVSEVGLGLMNVSWAGRSGTDPVLRYEVAIKGIHRALDEGITLLDTADVYAPSWDQMGHNELLVREALELWSGSAEQKSRLVIATKGGITRSPGEVWGEDSSRDYLLRAAEASRSRLGVDQIDVYQHHRPDPGMDIDSQIENLRAVKEEGIAKNLGLSNYSREHLQLALDILGGPDDGGVVSVQNELSPYYRHDVDVVELCEDRGLAYLTWSPLGGAKRVSELSSGDIPVLAQMAKNKGVSVPRLVLAWLLALSPSIIALPGATRPESVADSAASSSLVLTNDEVEEIMGALPESDPVRDKLLPRPPRR